jgi:membrane protease subunit (stomatin/prohibitin family)
MKNGQDIEKAFKQCKSYGKWGNAQTLVLIDKYQILVFNKHNGTFDSSKYDLFYWSDVINGNADKYNALKKLLS